MFELTGEVPHDLGVFAIFCILITGALPFLWVGSAVPFCFGSSGKKCNYCRLLRAFLLWHFVVSDVALSPALVICAWSQ